MLVVIEWSDDDFFLWSVEDDLRLQNQVLEYWGTTIYFSVCDETKSISNLFFFFLIFCLFRAALKAYGSS